MKTTLLISLFSITSLLTCAQSEELVYWDSQSTFTYSYPQAGDSLAAVVTAASQTPSGLTPYQYVDSRNIWYNPNSNLVVNPSTDPYLDEPQGVYLLFIKANEKKATIRLIKE